MAPFSSMARVACLAAALAAAGAARAHDAHLHEDGSAGPELTANPAALGSAYVKPDLAKLGGPFTLIDHEGRTVTEASWPGQWLLITFGFPGCRESCPVVLDFLGKAMDILGPEAARVQPLFVDVSMDKTPDIRGMKQFVGNFHERIVGLSGSRAQTFAMVRNYMVRREYAKMSFSTKETGPRINHTTNVYMVDPTGRVRGFFYHDLPPEKMAAAIRDTMAGLGPRGALPPADRSVAAR